MIYDTCQKNLSVQSIMSFWLIQTSILQRLYTPKYKSSIPFFVFHFIFHQSQFIMYFFKFPYKIAKV